MLSLVSRRTVGSRNADEKKRKRARGAGDVGTARGRESSVLPPV